jgi:hypothetical protein
LRAVESRLTLLSSADADAAAVVLSGLLDDFSRELAEAIWWRGPEEGFQRAHRGGRIFQRASRGLSGREIAKAAGISEATVQRILQSARGRFLPTGGDAVRVPVG